MNVLVASLILLCSASAVQAQKYEVTIIDRKEMTLTFRKSYLVIQFAIELDCALQRFRR